MKKGIFWFWFTIGVLVIGGFGYTAYLKTLPGKLDDFTSCLTEKKAVFYGAFWCPHCQKTKALFGNSAKHLPYVECSTPDGQGQTQACKDANIASYPTWAFADDSRLTGERTLQELAEKTGCTLPQ